jgi:predicted ATPase
VIHRLSLRAFKCFRRDALDLGPLTILAGANGAGKSTVLQALLLLHQALCEDAGAQGRELPLTGSVLAMGTVRDVVDKDQGGKTFQLGVTSGALTIKWTLGAKRSATDELAAALLRTDWTNSPGPGRHGAELFPQPLLRLAAGRSLRHALETIRYVPADRVGPRESYPLVEPGGHRTLGGRAERAVGALYWGRDAEVAPAMRHPALPQLRLDRQVEAWLGDLFPGVRLDVQRVSNANLVTLGIAIKEGDFHRPQNVGFGMSYALPIVVAILSARPGDLVVIDSPEAHLHPRAQVALTRLLVSSAATNVQVIVETHSDHVLNAVRVAVHRGEIRRRGVRVHFFDRADLSEPPRRQEVSIDRRGRFDGRPNGFFDEIDRQLTALLEPPNLVNG